MARREVECSVARGGGPGWSLLDSVLLVVSEDVVEVSTEPLAENKINENDELLQLLSPNRCLIAYHTRFMIH